jgi:hypothetical protein
MSIPRKGNRAHAAQLDSLSSRQALREAPAPQARVPRRGPARRHDEEALMVARYCVGLLLLGIVPLFAFLGAYYFMPDLFVLLGGARAF